MTRVRASVSLPATLALIGALLISKGTSQVVSNIDVAVPPPPLSYNALGMLQVTWSVTGSAPANGFEVTLRPLDQTDDFLAQPVGGKNPWFLDTNNNSASSWSYSGGFLRLNTNGVATTTASSMGRGNAVYAYRKLPEGSTMDLSFDCGTAFSVPNAWCGAVIFHAGWNTHLGFCGLVRSGGSTTAAAIDSIGGSNSAAWTGTSAAVRVSWDEPSKSFSCYVASASGTPATVQAALGAAPRWALSQLARSPTVFGGDLWFGPALSTSGGGGGSVSASFDWARVFKPIPAVTPPSVTGAVDRCFTKANVQAETQTVPSTARSAVFSGLHSNFPYSVEIVELQAGGRVPATEFVPHAFARPLPPRAWAIGAYYSAATLTPGTRMDSWVDSSGNAHHLTGVIAGGKDNRPVAIWSQGAMKAANFDRRSAWWMSSGSDAIDFGGASPFSLYSHTLLTTSSPSIIASRGINSKVTEQGWALMEYADLWNPWPGERGVRVSDRQGNVAATSMVNFQRWGYLYQTTHSAIFEDAPGGGLGGAAANQLYPHNPKMVRMYRSMDYYGEEPTDSDFLGFADGVVANGSYYPQPLTVDWSSGAPVPALTPETVNFKVGGPINAAGDPFRSMGGQMHSLVTYREAHPTATRYAVHDWLDWANLRRCYGIVTPNSAVSDGNVCGSGRRDDYCYEGCSNTFAQTAGTNDHWCQGGRWSGAPAICKKQCPTYPRPNFMATCSRVYLKDDFVVYSESWNRFVVYPSTPDIVRDLMWSLKDGVMTAFTNDPCRQTYATHMALHPNRWDLIIPYGGQQVVSARIRLDSATARAGLSVHFQSEGYNYLVTLSKTEGLRFYRNTNTEIARDASVATQLTVGEWIDFSFSSTNLWTFEAFFGNTSVWRGTDNTASGPTWGSGGLYADGQAAFRNFSITGSCDGGGNCVAMSAGQTCTYTCEKGYKPVTVTNGVVECTDSGVHNGYMQCLTVPPTFTPATYEVKEHCAEATPVGRVVATPSAPRQQIDYAITAVFPRIMNLTFEIGSCSGMILVKDPSLVLYNFVKNVTVTVRARPDFDNLAAAFMNFTITIIDVDIAPSFVPPTQYMSVPENYRGPIGQLTTYDEDDADQGRLVYGILVGNDQVPPLFSINASSGMVYAAQPLDFESQAMYSLLVQAYELRDRGMLGTAPLAIEIIDVNDAPLLQNTFVVLDESVASNRALATNYALATLVAFDPDNSTANPGWSSVSYAIVTNARNGTTDLLALSVSNGQATVRLTSPLNWFDDYFFYFQSAKTRGIFNANISACDAGTPPLCAYSAFTLVIQANFSAPLKPTLFAVSRSDSFQTTGGEAVDFIGADFGEIIQTGPGSAPFAINATYCSGTTPQRCYRASGCTVIITLDAGGKITQEVIRCFTVPGWGAGLTWNVSVDTKAPAALLPTRRLVPVQAAPLTLSYGDPELDSVRLQSGSLSTAGGFIVNITGRNFGPNDTDISLSFGPTGANGAGIFTMQKLFAAHTFLLARVNPGCGANLPVTVVVGGTQVSRSRNQGATSISFPSPSITSIELPDTLPGVALGYSLTTLRTIGGDRLVLKGMNFGPSDLPDTSAGALPGATVAVVPAVTYENIEADPMRFVLPGASCYKEPATAHTTIFCTTVPGAGAGFRWSAQLCGLTSPFSTATTSFKPPVVTGVSGVGRQGASTQGGQQLVITGTDLGYVPANPSDMTRKVIRAANYGAEARLQYNATDCRVIDATRVECLTNEGTGKNHSLRVNVGGQLSPIFAASISYAEPVISAFSRGQTSPTVGGEEIVISGANFGKWPELVEVFYTDRPLVRRARDGLLPGSPPGVVTMFPRSCSFLINHVQLLCIYNEGAGRKLIWDMRVDGQLSASPSTRYLEPTINAITLLDGAGKASTRGGTRVILNGTNFGLEPLIQYIRFGVSGTEYLISNFTYISHFQVLLTLPPGIGQRLRFTITVSDQTSDPSAATFDYAPPTITSVTPNVALTNYDARRPTIVTVRGKDFGLFDPTADVAIAFGNGDDLTLQPMLSPSSRVPVQVDVETGNLPPGSNSPGFEEVVTFTLPESLGANRSIRIVPYRRGATPTRADILALPVGGVTDVFQFSPGYIESIYVTNVRLPEERQQMAIVFPSYNPADDPPPTSRRIEISGRSFGPTQRTDQVQRILEAKDPGSATGWSTINVGYVPVNYTHEKVLGYARVTAATIRVRIVARGPFGEQAVSVSNELTFSDVSPRISGLVGGQDGYVTQGGEWLVMKVTGLEATRALNVTIGGRQAVLYDYTDASRTTVVPYDQAQQLIVYKQGQPFGYPGTLPFPPLFEWTLLIRVPEGEDARQAVLVRRDGSDSNTDVTIDYYPPRIAAVGVWEPSTGAYTMQAFDPAVPLLIPTEKARVMINGTNMGLCPRITYITLSPVLVDACPEVVVGGVLTKMRNPNVTRSHFAIELPAPDGVGTGRDVDPINGFVFELLVGTQVAQSRVPFRYRAPSIASVAPSSGPTTGGDTLTIIGNDFGGDPRFPPTVALGRDDVGWQPCLNVVRYSHQRITCTSPEGVGAGMTIRVTVASQSGTGGTFSYIRPTVSNVVVSSLAPSGDVASLINSGASRTDYVWSSSSKAYGAGGTPLTADPVGGAVVTLQGANFGPRKYFNMNGGSCVFALWDAVLVQATADRSSALSKLACDGAINTNALPGEGEVRSADILSWSHSAVTFRLPAGHGGRKFIIMVGGQLPLPDLGTVSWGRRAQDAAAATADADAAEPQSRALQTPGGGGAPAGPTPSPMPMPAELGPDLVFSQPRIAVTPSGTAAGIAGMKLFSTKGGEPFALRGRFFPPPTMRLYADGSNNGPTLATETLQGGVNATFPEPSSLPLFFAVVKFNGRCIALARDWKGAEVSGLRAAPPAGSVTDDQRRAIAEANARAGCPVVLEKGDVRSVMHDNEAKWVSRNTSTWGPSGWPAAGIIFGDRAFTLDEFAFNTSAGIGVNRSVSLRVYGMDLRTMEAMLLSESNAVNVSYAPPSIVGFGGDNGRRIDIDKESTEVDVIIRADNMGDVFDMRNWSPEELDIRVTVDGKECSVMSKDYSNDRACLDTKGRYQGFDGMDYVKCQLNVNETTAGFKTVTLRIAGQEGVLVANRTDIALRAVCKAGLFGQPNQTCLPCPTGAACGGYLSKEDSEFTAGTVYWGSTTYDGYGFHRPAVPQVNFFNLNGTMAVACPKSAPGRYPDRDVCIVACSPKEACLGSNTCAIQYASKAPSFRCASCAMGYFRRGPECIPCPRNPALLIVGVLLGICAVAGLGYYLQRAKINIAIASIGIDYFQVLAIFSNAKINWPPEIRELLYIFSAFNLNIEIVAPECLMPDVSFKQKWFAIMAIPIGVYFILLLIQGANIIYRVLIKGQKCKQSTADAGQVAMSSLLTLFYLMYIYLSKNVFDVLTCVPVEPDDGQLYMTAGSAGLEPCGVEGGTQMSLLPWAIFGLVLYVIGYPVALTYLFITRRELIMEDQLLRCRDQGDDALTNPHALKIRRTFSRAYYAFKPDLWFWTIIILARKMAITTTFVIFAQNPHFQLAACLLICFLGYAAQVRFQPYMPPSAFEEIYRDHQLMSLVPTSVHARLAARIAEIDTKAKKAARSNRLKLAADERVNFVANWIFEYNTVDAVLLFCAVLVNLMGLMYASIDGTSFSGGQKGITYVIILVIAFSVTYLILALITDVRLQCKARAAKSAEKSAEQRAETRSKSKKEAMTAADVKKVAYETAARGRRQSTKLAMNPMFVSAPTPTGAGGAGAGGEGGDAAALARADILGRAEAPDGALWNAFKQQFSDLMEESTTTSKELGNTRMQLRRVMEALNVTSVEDLMAALSRLGASAAGRPTKAAGRTRTAYKPMLSADEPGSETASTAAATFGAGAGAGASGASLAGYSSPAAANRMRAGGRKPGAAAAGDGAGVELSPMDGGSGADSTPRARRPSRVSVVGRVSNALGLGLGSASREPLAAQTDAGSAGGDSPTSAGRASPSRRRTSVSAAAVAAAAAAAGRGADF